MNGQAMDGTRIASTVALAGAGDEAAFAQLVSTYHADMAWVAFAACGDRELAEEPPVRAVGVDGPQLGCAVDLGNCVRHQPAIG